MEELGPKVRGSIFIKCPEEANPRESGCGRVAAGARERPRGQQFFEGQETVVTQSARAVAQSCDYTQKHQSLCLSWKNYIAHKLTLL